MIGLIKTEIKRDLTQCAAVSEASNNSEEVEEQLEGQHNAAASDNFDSENETLNKDHD